MSLVEEYRLQERRYQQEKQRLSEQFQAAEKAYMHARSELQDTEKRYREKEANLKQMIAMKSKLAAKVDKSQENLKHIRQELEAVMEQYEKKIVEFQKNGDTYGGLVLDDKFVEDFLAEDEEKSTKAQLGNPWTTDAYNREREKLLFYSLQLTREFILSSKCCRENFVLLGQYWGLELGDEKERILFHKQDREEMCGALYQTLFLLVPVISSTFASVGTLLKDVREPGMIGTLIVDEAGQAQPQMAVGSLYRSRRAIIVGDPKQVEPVVTDDLELLKTTYKDDLYRCYRDKTLSVQKCADIMNPFGTYLDNGTDYPDWVGCPLLVHRRCISPMYDISNKISYGGIMKQQTKLPSEKEQRDFVFSKSQWLNVVGDENGNRDHYVVRQGEEVCQILEQAFQKSENPNLYIISPFTSVVRGIKKAIGSYCSSHRESSMAKNHDLGDWMDTNIGTVHTFQGKEANEVIFLLGCDNKKASEGAIKWVNSNIVNVAVTRAKYRLCVIGDGQAWRKNPIVGEMKALIDTFALRYIDEIQKGDLNDNEKAAKYQEAAKQIPSATSFLAESGVDENQEPQYTIETDDFVSDLREVDFFDEDLSDEQLNMLGFHSSQEFGKLEPDVKKNLTMGIKLYELLEPVYQVVEDLDASCCGILFCKALEIQMRRNLVNGLKETCSNYVVKYKNKDVKLSNVNDDYFMLGNIQYVIKGNIIPIGKIFQNLGDPLHGSKWWSVFSKKLHECAEKRNKCCHVELFEWEDMVKLLQLVFERNDNRDTKKINLDGIFFESEVGKQLGSGSC